MIQQISLEQYNLLLNNKVLFQNIKNIKKVNDKLYVSFIGDTSGDRKIILCKEIFILTQNILRSLIFTIGKMFDKSKVIYQIYNEPYKMIQKNENSFL